MTTPNPWGNRGPVFERLMGERAGLPGDIAEFGVYNGGSTVQLAQYGRRVWAFDTFAGMPAAGFDAAVDHDKPGSFVPTVDLWEVFGSRPNIVPICGVFDWTLAVVPSWVRFALIYMDCDLKNSYRTVLKWLPEHLVPGAAVVMDDYHACRGAKAAVDEWLRRWDLSIEDELVVVWRG